MAAPIAGLSTDRGAQYAQLDPDPCGGDDEGQRGSLQEPGREGAPATDNWPVQGGRQPAGQQEGKEEHRHERERRPAGEESSDVELHPAGDEKERDEDTEADADADTAQKQRNRGGQRTGGTI
jgi:hypothetical protein